MTNIIDGKKISKEVISELTSRYKSLQEQFNTEAQLAIILVGDNPASKIYIANKCRAAQQVGIKTHFLELPDNISQEKLLFEIEQLNQDNKISGIIVQLPLPRHISKQKVITAISPNKDVDGFHPFNVGLLYSAEQNGFVPCTALGCLKLIKAAHENIVGKHVVIIGRSSIVGRPLAALLLKENCTVTICHSATKNLIEHTQKADIVVSAIGRPQYLDKKFFPNKSTVIDVGISRIEKNGKSVIVGDVNFHDVQNHVYAITPVPGGVGPMTVAYLLVNTVEAWRRQS